MNIVQRLDAFGSYSRSLVDSISVEDLAAQDTLHRQGTIRPGCDPSHADTNRFVGSIHNYRNTRDGKTARPLGELHISDRSCRRRHANLAENLVRLHDCFHHSDKKLGGLNGAAAV